MMMARVITGLVFAAATVAGLTVAASGPTASYPIVRTVADCHGPADCGYGDNGHNSDH